MTLRIRNWRQFQQYNDRCPPWIKLHREILQSEDWVMWDDASRVLAVACMLLASRTEDGSLPANPSYIKRAAYLNTDPNLQPLIDCGFLELGDDAIEVYETLASCTTETEKRQSREETEHIKRTHQKFTPPTVDEVRAYMLERGTTSDPERFVDFYESKGWMVGKNKMKDWKAAVRNWERNAGPKGKPMRGNDTPPGKYDDIMAMKPRGQTDETSD